MLALFLQGLFLPHQGLIHPSVFFTSPPLPVSSLQPSPLSTLCHVMFYKSHCQSIRSTSPPYKGLHSAKSGLPPPYIHPTVHSDCLWLPFSWEHSLYLREKQVCNPANQKCLHFSTYKTRLTTAPPNHPHPAFPLLSIFSIQFFDLSDAPLVGYEMNVAGSWPALFFLTNELETE